MPNFTKMHFQHFLPLGWPQGVKKIFFAKLIIFPNSGDQNTPTLRHKLFFRKIFIFEKSVQSGNSEKRYIPMPYQVGDFFILLSSIYTFNGISISFIIFRSRFKFILPPLCIMVISHLNLRLYLPIARDYKLGKNLIYFVHLYYK